MAPVVTLEGAAGKEYSTGSEADFIVTLSDPSLETVTVSYRTVADGSAVEGTDYDGQTGTVTFKAGQTFAAVEVDVKGDTRVETNESFSLVVTPNGYIQNGTEDSAGSATILPNEREGDNGDNLFNGTRYSDVLSGLGGNDLLSGWGSNDILLGGAGNDVLHGGDGNDIVRGGNKRDQLFGEQGDDKLFGGAGADTLSGGSGDDIIEGGGGMDTVDYSGAASGIRVDLSITKAQGTKGAGLDTLTSIEHVIGSGFADRIKGNEIGNRLFGGRTPIP